jgi:hypothetical protein
MRVGPLHAGMCLQWHSSPNTSWGCATHAVLAGEQRAASNQRLFCILLNSFTAFVCSRLARVVVQGKLELQAQREGRHDGEEGRDLL